MVDRVEIQLAQLSHIMASSFGNKTKMVDFMPTRGKESKKENKSELENQVKTIFGG